MSFPEKADRLLEERLFHEAQARERSNRPSFLSDLVQKDQEYLDHASWIQPGIDSLGEIAGKLILDWGSGHGMASVCMARRGATVFSVDLSLGYCKESVSRALTNQVGRLICSIQSDACRLPFKDDLFDGIWGNAILHHVSPEGAAKELFRVLKPGGILVLCDPWQGSKLVRFIRDYIPYPGKSRTRDETPLDFGFLKIFTKHFQKIELSHWDFLGGLERLIPLGPFRKIIRKTDRLLLDSIPWIANSSRYVMIKAIKEGPTS
jgi:SAM-dependent methyltransferase